MYTERNTHSRKKLKTLQKMYTKRSYNLRNEHRKKYTPYEMYAKWNKLQDMYIKRNLHWKNVLSENYYFIWKMSYNRNKVN